MYTYQTKDCGILYTALSEYRNACENSLKVEGLPLCIVQEFNRTIERVNEILEEL